MTFRAIVGEAPASSTAYQAIMKITNGSSRNLTARTYHSIATGFRGNVVIHSRAQLHFPSVFGVSYQAPSNRPVSCVAVMMAVVFHGITSFISRRNTNVAYVTRQCAHASSRPRLEHEVCSMPFTRLPGNETARHARAHIGHDGARFHMRRLIAGGIFAVWRQAWSIPDMPCRIDRRVLIRR